MTYIIFHDGFPGISEQMPIFTPNRLGLIARFWETTKAYGPNDLKVPVIKEEIHFTAFQRLLAQTVYNPKEEVEFNWQSKGKYELCAITQDLQKGLDKDGDILQQWFDANEVLRLVSSARTFDETVIAFQCLEGAHEVDEKARQYVQRVLGSQQGA